MAMIVDQILAERNLTYGSNSPMLTSTPTTLNGQLVLSALSNSVQVVTGSALGFSFKLPVATTLTNGWKFELYNDSSRQVNIYYNSGDIFGYMLPYSYTQVTLEDDTTANGSWLRWGVYTGGTASGILNYSVSSSTPFTLSAGTADTLITGMALTPVQGEYAIWYDGSIVLNGNNTICKTTLYKAGTLWANSLRTIRSSVSTFYTSHLTSGIIPFTGSEVLEVRVSRSANSLTINSRSIRMIRLGDGV